MASPSKTYFKGSMKDRLLHYSRICPVTGCWLWTGGIDSDGYARVQSERAHRASYETFVGLIPYGTEIDHECRVRHCINPDHLRAIPHAENVRCGDSGKHLSDRTHCDHGHEFSVANTIILPGTAGRACRECQRLAKKRFREREKLKPTVKPKSRRGEYQSKTHALQLRSRFYAR